MKKMTVGMWSCVKHSKEWSLFWAWSVLPVWSWSFSEAEFLIGPRWFAQSVNKFKEVAGIDWKRSTNTVHKKWHCYSRAILFFFRRFHASYFCLLLRCWGGGLSLFVLQLSEWLVFTGGILLKRVPTTADTPTSDTWFPRLQSNQNCIQLPFCFGNFVGWP